ncbi:DUF3027 domain-containing protein [Pseudoclavibacter soli]|uniref:DUF3027 domain-containing protein n=1 Tax=Pseudoclavibacter soli TaxID=452623 RepID=UPI0004145FD9|nr:DUF3027 domain-containing protein [Pseudoclavibacter soli]
MADEHAQDLQAFIDQAPLAQAALQEIADARQIGALLRAEAEADPNACTLRFASDVPGYPHWEWAAVMGRADASAIPTVLEVGLLPGEGALVPPAWVPWSERFAEYKAARAEQPDEESPEDAEAASDTEAASDGESVPHEALAPEAAEASDEAQSGQPTDSSEAIEHVVE